MQVLRALVVDDEPRIVRSLAHLLVLHEIEATTAQDGLEAWSLFENTPDSWQIMISDIRMPRLDGLSLGRRIRAYGGSMGFIFMSGHGEIPALTTLLPAVFLAKPFRRAELLDAIQRLETERR